MERKRAGGKTSGTLRYASGTASLSRVSEKVLPLRPEIEKAGVNVEDQDTHGILFG